MKRDEVELLTEHEKLLAGQEYDYRDPEIQKMIQRARKMAVEINQEVDMEHRRALIDDLFAKAGKNLALMSPFQINYGSHVSLGDDVLINTNCNFQDSNLITIGDRVLVGPDVKFYCVNMHLMLANALVFVKMVHGMSLRLPGPFTLEMMFGLVEM